MESDLDLISDHADPEYIPDSDSESSGKLIMYTAAFICQSIHDNFIYNCRRTFQKCSLILKITLAKTVICSVYCVCWYGSLGGQSKRLMNDVVNVCSKVVGERSMQELYE